MTKISAHSCCDAGESKFAMSSSILLFFKMIINRPLSSADHILACTLHCYSLFKSPMRTQNNIFSCYSFIIQCKMSAGKDIPSQAIWWEIFSFTVLCSITLVLHSQLFHSPHVLSVYKTAQTNNPVSSAIIVCAVRAHVVLVAHKVNHTENRWLHTGAFPSLSRMKCCTKLFLKRTFI